MTDTKNCIECGKELFGRSDKKFCSDACRSAYNNMSVNTNDKYIRRVNRKLSKNRQILSKLNPEGKATHPKEKLAKEGFDFDFYTNTYTTKDKKIYYFCYDQGYLMLSDDFVLIVKREVEN
ncbi:MAG: DNA-directed RNA polymerase subunit M/transcription elongation factor TFIIS [Marinoscillum sp.]|jgi:DNA-directed RNA polymerase subunit M/transcription elongation factor TFIIS